MSSRVLERIVMVHAVIFLTATTWAFGGNAAWVQGPLAILGTVGAMLTLLLVFTGPSPAQGSYRAFSYLWPWLIFNALVLASCLTSGFRELRGDSQILYLPIRVAFWRPSAARPLLALDALWRFDGAYLSALNIALAARRRRTLRLLVSAVVLNAVALAVFGTLQKLVHANGIFFGRVPTPQPYFFASFIYRNHWGAYALMMTAACAGLTWHHLRRAPGEQFRRTPVLAEMLGVLVLAATIPLSGSRACTLLLLILGAGAAAAALVAAVRVHRSQRIQIGSWVAGSILAGIAAWALIWAIAGDVISLRLRKTQEQIAVMRAQGDIGSRRILYSDTLRMTRDRPLFGWGMDSYPYVFLLYNTQKPNSDRLPVVYHDAHTDWLQALAEHGYLGTAALFLCAWVPLRKLRGAAWRDPIPVFLLSGAALVAFYAAVEFPFGNGAVVLTWWIVVFTAIRFARLGTPTGAEP